MLRRLTRYSGCDRQSAFHSSSVITCQVFGVRSLHSASLNERCRCMGMPRDAQCLQDCSLPSFWKESPTYSSRKVVFVVQACPCTPSTIFQGNWDYGEPGMADGRGLLDRQNNQFVMRPGDWNSPYQGWWYMIHGGASSECPVICIMHAMIYGYNMGPKT